MSADTTHEAVERLVLRMDASAIAYKERAPCCGELCSAGVCAAPACHFGDVMSGLQNGADTLRALLAERDAAWAECEMLREAANELRLIQSSLTSAHLMHFGFFCGKQITIDDKQEQRIRAAFAGGPADV
jgi:hypothetical protein